MKGGLRMECVRKGPILIVPEGTVRIGFLDICDYLWDRSVEEVWLPSTLKVIEDHTFFDFTQIKKITIPESVVSIGAQAFWGLDALERLLIPSTVECVEKGAFCNLSRCELVITGPNLTIPQGWAAEFAINVKKVRMLSLE